MTNTIYSRIVGIKNHQDTIKTCNIGDSLKLLRDPTNTYDKNAIKVLTLENKELGYINKFINMVLADQLDNGIEFNVEIENITGKDKDLMGCNISINQTKTNELYINDGKVRFSYNHKYIFFKKNENILTITRDDLEKCLKLLKNEKN